MMQLRLRFRHKQKGQLLELYANYAGSFPINVVSYGNMHRIIILTARGSFLRLGTQGRVVFYGMQACNIGFVTKHGQWIPYHIILHPDDVITWKHFRVTGPLWGESTGHQWIPLTKASDTRDAGDVTVMGNVPGRFSTNSEKNVTALISKVLVKNSKSNNGLWYASEYMRITVLSRLIG